ncbi:MAG: glycosyltransferase [Deltaproteobacteria bacterium]|nr:glycosyltransferase [Deltaproteobacteria bacterium]
MKKKNKRKRSGSPTLSLCMIVKDEEAHLTRCLESVRGCVDEIIIVDTGSSDRTPEIARNFGAKVFFHPWEGDFSKHRNQSLAYATGEWILIIDADEELDRQSAGRVKGIISKSKYPVISGIVRSYLGKIYNEQTSPRLFRNGIGIRYEGIVHNQLVYNGDTLFSPEIVIWHHGYNLSGEANRVKIQRTRALLKKQIEIDPDYAPAHHNLAVNYYNCEEWEKAIEEGKRTIEILERMKISDKGYSWTFYTIVDSLLKLKRIDEAESWAMKGIPYDDMNPDSYWLLTMIHFTKNDFQKVLNYSKRYLALCEAWKNKGNEVGKPTDYISNTLDRAWEIYRILGFASMEIHGPKEALDAFLKSISLSPEPQKRHEEYGLFFFQKKEFALAKRFLEKVPISSSSSFQALCALGKVYEGIGLERAVDYYNHMERAFPKKSEIPFQKGDLLIRMKLFPEAAEAFGRCIEIDPELIEAYINLGFVHERMGATEEAEHFYRKTLQYDPNSEIARLNLIVLTTEGGRFDEAKELFDAFSSQSLSSGLFESLSENLYFHLLLARIDLACGQKARFRMNCLRIFEAVGERKAIRSGSLLDSSEGFRRIADQCKSDGDLRSSRVAMEIASSLTSPLPA